MVRIETGKLAVVDLPVVAMKAPMFFKAGWSIGKPPRGFAGYWSIRPASR